MKLNLGCGQNAVDGFVGVDIKNAPHVDVVCDLFQFPWPWRNESIEEVLCVHFFEHVPARIRFKFMDELYRVLIPHAKAVFITPHWASRGAVQDPTHEWPPIVAQSYLYFNKQWRETEKLDHYDVHCDFHFESVFYTLEDEVARQPDQQRIAMAENCINTIKYMRATLVKRPGDPYKEKTEILHTRE